MLREHRALIRIADENDSAAKEPTHGMVDLAAALAEEAWVRTPLAKAVRQIHEALDDVIPYEGSDLFNALEFTRQDAIRFGARLGFALARTMASADRGWAAWEAEADSWLRSAECTVEAHQGTLDSLHEQYDEDIEKVKALGRKQTAPSAQDQAEPPPVFIAAMKLIGRAVDEAVSGHERKHLHEHHADLVTHDKVAMGLTGLSNTVQESLDEHVRQHHAEPSAPPVQEPSAPKTRPTVQPPRKRQPAASKPAAAPPARHRAHELGHVAAAVPQLDQCAGDDLELAGHRHPRATDPWFAEHGAG